MHIALVLAKPTVEPSKSTPLKGKEVEPFAPNSLSHTGCADMRQSSILRDELGVVVLDPRQEAALTPLKEATQRELGIGADVYLVSVGPDIQTDQHHANTHGTIQLRQIKHNIAIGLKVNLLSSTFCAALFLNVKGPGLLQTCHVVAGHHCCV